jgi:hypothetical protein
MDVIEEDENLGRIGQIQSSPGGSDGTATDIHISHWLKNTERPVPFTEGAPEETVITREASPAFKGLEKGIDD